MEIITISTKSLNKSLAKAVQAIKKAKVIVCPTDTVYGLIAVAQNKEAVKKVFEIKKRRSKKPLPVFIKNIKMAKGLAYIDKKQETFLKKVWPGKITAVLKARKVKFPQGILTKDKKIGLRIPDYKFLKFLLKKADCPLTATSANISGQKALTKIKEVIKQFEDKKYQPDLILDAGSLKPCLPSTVIDLISGKIIRQGIIPENKILRILHNLR